MISLPTGGVCISRFPTAMQQLVHGAVNQNAANLATLFYDYMEADKEA